MFITCWKCKKQNDHWVSRSLPETVILNGKELYKSFTYSKYFCPIVERKIRDKFLPENQEKISIIDCLNGDREETREKPVEEEKIITHWGEEKA